jgi:hypothetical protein
MPRYVKNNCEICSKEFEVIYKKRNQKTCSKKCAYKLRKKNKNTSIPKQKKCNSCGKDFFDKTKLKNQTECKDCKLKKGVETRKLNGSYERTEDQNRKLSETLKSQYKSGERKFSKEALEKLSKGLTKRWASGEMKNKTQETCLKKYGVNHWTKSKQAKKKLSNTRKGFKFSKKVRHNMSKAAVKRIKKYRIYSFGNGGFREDINLYVRSNWEANFARVLKYKKINFQYEPDTFELSEAMTYTPDFKVGNVYFEIKGYMDDRSKEKISAFKKSYPNVLLSIITGDEYNILRDTYSDKILWEGK